MTAQLLRPIVLAALAVGSVIGGCILQLAGSSGPENAGILLVVVGFALGFAAALDATAAKKAAARQSM